MISTFVRNNFKFKETTLLLTVFFQTEKVKSISNGQMHSWTYGRVNARVHEKVFVLFQESFNATTIFLQLRHFLLDAFREVRVGPIKSRLSCMASTRRCDLLSQLN